MASSFFDDKARKPDEASLSEALGKAKRCWDAIIDHLDKKCDGHVREWKFYGEKYGWQLKVVHNKRSVLYLVPRKDSFMASLALKEKAVDAVRASGLPPSLIRDIENAKAYPEGKPARIEVTGKKQADIVKQLLEIKLST